MTALWVSERLTCGFFLYLLALAVARPLEPRRRTRVLLVSVACIAATLLVSELPPSALGRVVREWIPGIFLLQGYWACGLFFLRPMRDIERRLLAVDRRLSDAIAGATIVDRTPRLGLEYLELAYLSVYPFIPVAFGAFCGLGLRDAADRFWVAVLAAGYGAYGVLPWLQTRPPRALEPASVVDRRGLYLRRLNLVVLDRASVQVNTFPSGHASIAVAAALGVASADPVWGVGALVLAASIAVATVVGRYHYTLDTLLGVALGALAWWIGFRPPGV